MIWRLTYCNKKGVEARVDIIKGDRTSVEIVQGSANPFTLSYKLDKNDKSGHIMTSSADIEFFETEEFNIDKLKTSNETELKVEYFEGNVLAWSGFILPDFFSREIGSPNIVRMTASDRLTALKGVTLSDLPLKISLRDLIELSLEQTGLSLALVAQIQINQGSTNILDSEILSQRLTDTRGRSISCYDILMSIMVATNSTIRQRAGQWQVYNKLEHELRTPTIFFDKVERGAIRTIQPVASSVGVYQEHGGGLSYPTNYDFSDNLNGWSAINGFDASIDNRQVDRYFFSGGNFIPSYGEVGDSNYVVNKYNNLFVDGSSPYLKSSTIEVIYPTEKSFNVEVEVNATNAMLAATNTVVDFAIIIEGNGNTLSMDGSGLFNEVVGGKPFIHRLLFPKAMPTGGFINKAATASKKVQGLAISPDDNFEGYTTHIRIYGSGGSYQSLIHSVSLKFSSVNVAPKGNLYKTTQGSNFTKLHDVETTIFGDYITNGLNGYFYDYPIDDTSNLYLPNGELSPPQWVTAFDPTERPLLHHISRQKSRLFSVAHDILRANINVESFDPLAVFQDCREGKYVIVSARFDFLRSEVDVELEQIAYDNEILKRDFIYSYFGEGESNIKSIGGIAGGGGTGGGGGMTSEQLEMLTNLASWWKLDEDNDAIYSEKSVYSLKGVSALGLGSEGGGGGGDIDMLDSWENYIPAKANFYVPASLLVPFRSDTLSRLDSLESGSATSITTTGSGNAITSLTKSGSVITADKGLTFALATHTHTIAQITGLQGALNLKATQSDIDTAINNIESGGRNFYSNNTSIFEYRAVVSNRNEGETVNGFKITSVDPYTNNRVRLISVINSNGWWTVSFDVRSDDATHVRIDITDIPDALQGANREISSEWRRVTCTVDVNNYIENLYHFVDIGISPYGDYSIEVRNIKVEKGNKATDWTPAPEDQVTDWSETDVNSFAFLKNKPTQLSQFTDDIGVASHIANTSNPHNVTKAQVGLSNVDNTSDLLKPISNAVQTALNSKLNLTGGTLTGNLSFSNSVSYIRLSTNLYGNAYIGSSGLGTPPSEEQDYGVYISSNAYRDADGKWYHGRTDTIPALRFKAGHHNHFVWSYSPNVGTGEIDFIDLMSLRSNGNLGIGTTNPLYKLDVAGTGRFTGNLTASAGVNTPKVIFAAAGWSLEQVGTELQMKHNGVIKQRMLSDGTILATGGITALST